MAIPVLRIQAEPVDPVKANCAMVVICARRFWARGYFSTTSGNVTDDVIKQYLELHSSK
jgi:REP element-mobilizing transposase RayT